MTRHPRLGAAGQPSVAVRDPSRNQRPTKFPSLQSARAALSVNLLNIKERKKPKKPKFSVCRLHRLRDLPAQHSNPVAAQVRANLDTEVRVAVRVAVTALMGC
jgi:hypothetical protein